MYLTILILPLLGAIFTGFFGRFFGFFGSSLLALTCIFLSFSLSLISFFEIGLSNTVVYLIIKPWICSGLVTVNWGFLFDSLTIIMLTIITFISFLVHVYSISYMATDPHFPRFLSFLEIFTFFMLLLVTADNIVQMFFGWEGVGLASYLLINFWFTKLSANKSAIKALIINRIGDFGLLFAIFAIFYVFKSFNYYSIFSMTPFFMDFNLVFFKFQLNSLSLISIFICVGAIGKSAQLGLHTWLPDAMEGPTPVSALIHAATMVTAGVFLLIRFSPLLEFSSVVLLILTIVGSLTALFGSIIGIFQNDLKKVIAYSTCSQLGYMIFCCGLSCYNISIFHLFNHAFFKALLFLCAGSIIHATSNEQDMRRMGSLINFLPVTYSLMLIGSFTLLGFPFLTGFYSKDLILELANVFRNNNLYFTIGVYACWLGNLAVLFTAFYSFRLIYLIFLNNTNLYRFTLVKIQESSYFMLLPLIILSIGSIFIGFLGRDLFIGEGSIFWNASIFTFPNNCYTIETEFMKPILKLIPFFLSMIGIFIATCINLNFFKIKIKFLINFLFFINKKMFFDFFINKIIVFPLIEFGYAISFKNLDKGFIEIIKISGLTSQLQQLMFNLSVFQNGQLTHYIFYLIIGFFLLLVNLFICNINLFDIIFYFIVLFFI